MKFSVLTGEPENFHAHLCGRCGEVADEGDWFDERGGDYGCPFETDHPLGLCEECEKKHETLRNPDKTVTDGATPHCQACGRPTVTHTARCATCPL